MGGAMPNHRPNLLLITVDCMRRDRLSAYGHRRQTTPFLDSLLDRSMHCTSAHSVSSWTCPAVISLLTGLYPYRHGGGIVPGDPKNLSKANLPTAIPRDIEAMPAVLGRGGYRTGAIGAVWNAHLPIPELFPDMRMMEKPARRLARAAIGWIRGGPEPWFLWLHFGDAHEPLRVAPGQRRAFGRIPRVPKVRRWDYQNGGSDVGGASFERYRDARTRLYDAAIRSVDASIREVLEALGSAGMERTVSVISADHGEELWEHRDEEVANFADPRDVFGVGHGHNLFQVHTLVPMLFLGPRIPAGAVGENVSLVDVFPTVLDALGVDGPAGQGGLDGVSLLGGPPAVDRPVASMGIAYGHEKRAVVVGDRKLLSSAGDGYEQVFILGPDRLETGRSDDPVEAAALRALLPGEATRLGEQVEATEEIESHLRGLGYIE